jgi:RNA polymerase sigma factor (sigma-70 family)
VRRSRSSVGQHEVALCTPSLHDQAVDQLPGMQRFRRERHNKDVTDAASDADLLIRARTSAEAFGQIYERHARTVHRYLVRRVGVDPADDLLGEVFVAAVDARLRVRIHESGSALPWLYGIAKNVVKSHLRSRRDQAEADVADEFDWSAVDARIDAAAQSHRLKNALAQLSTGELEVLLLVSWEQLTVTQAAESLGISAVAARSRLHRARARANAALSSAEDATAFTEDITPTGSHHDR